MKTDITDTIDSSYYVDYTNYKNYTTSPLLSFRCDSHCFVQINMDGFFPCSQKNFKKLLKIIMDDGEEFTILEKLHTMLPERLEREKDRIPYLIKELSGCIIPLEKRKRENEIKHSEKNIEKIKKNIDFFDAYFEERKNVIIQRLHLGQREGCDGEI